MDKLISNKASILFPELFGGIGPALALRLENDKVITNTIEFDGELSLFSPIYFEVTIFGGLVVPGSWIFNNGFNGDLKNKSPL